MLNTKRSSSAPGKLSKRKNSNWYYIGLIILITSIGYPPSSNKDTNNLPYILLPLVSTAHADQIESTSSNQSNYKNDPKRWTWLWYIHRMISTFAGMFCAYLGYKLFVLGVSGQASLIFENKTTKARLVNASPGIFFALFGMALVAFIVWTT